MRFIDLVAGLGGFCLVLERLGHECVFAFEIDGQVREVLREELPCWAAGPRRHPDR